MSKWYVANMGNDFQGLVVDETTGDNIAAIYDKANARLISLAPEMYEALKTINDSLLEAIDLATINKKGRPSYVSRWEDERKAVQNLIAKVEEGR